MEDLLQRQLIIDVSRELMGDFAPQELPFIFRTQSEEYFKNPKKVLNGRSGRDEVLGFGMGETVTFLTPIVLAIMQDVITFLAEEVKQSLKAQAAPVINEYVARIFKRYAPTPINQTVRTDAEEKSTALTADQLHSVRQLVLNGARQLKIADDKAELLANLIVGRLIS